HQQNHHPHHIIDHQQNNHPHHIINEQKNPNQCRKSKKQPYDHVHYNPRQDHGPQNNSVVKEHEGNIHDMVNGQYESQDMNKNKKKHKNCKNRNSRKEKKHPINDNSSGESIKHVYNKFPQKPGRHTNNVSLEKQNSHEYNVNIQDGQEPVYFNYEDMLRVDKSLFTTVNNICEIEFISTKNYLMTIIDNDESKHNSLNDNDAILKEINKTQNKFINFQLPLEITVPMALRISERLRAFIFDKELTPYYIKQLTDIFELEKDASKIYYYYLKCQNTYEDKKGLFKNLDSIKLCYDSQIDKNFVYIPKDKIPGALSRISNFVNDLLFLLPEFS
ncbi:conserved Plasmodium protein, unknown function, partial [Plasmodium gaboni]